MPDICIYDVSYIQLTVKLILRQKVSLVYTRNTSALTHGIFASFLCDSDSEHCSRPHFCSNACIHSRTSYNGTWTGNFPTCTGTINGAVNFNTNICMNKCMKEICAHCGKGFGQLLMVQLM